MMIVLYFKNNALLSLSPLSLPHPSTTCVIYIAFILLKHYNNPHLTPEIHSLVLSHDIVHIILWSVILPELFCEIFDLKLALLSIHTCIYFGVVC